MIVYLRAAFLNDNVLSFLAHPVTNTINKYMISQRKRQK